MKRRWIRGLRPRLTISYVLFFTVLLSFLGLFFRETLRAIYTGQVRDLLSQDWGSIRGYLRIERGRVIWFADLTDPEEALTVERLRQVYLLTDGTGRVMQVSPLYIALGVESQDLIRRSLQANTPIWRVRRGANNAPYLIRSGAFIEGRRMYYLALGRSLAESEAVVDRFTRNYFLLLPLMIAVGSLFGWFMAGRALEPLNQLADTAQRITGSNLSASIPPRGAGDELDRLIESFNRMIERLNASFTMTRQFSTDVSHELRTPLTAIRGQLEVAMLTAKTEEQYREAILNALQDVERLSQTIRALLLLSRAESGQVALQKQPIELSRAAAEIVDQFQIPAEEAGLHLSAELPPGCAIDGDPVQIDRLLSNLLSNAMKYTPSGGRVHVTIARANSEVRLSVADTGVGIPPDHLPHIFDRFYRVPGSESNPERGLGLGLSFVAWIVKAHDGRIDVQSKPGEGTIFQVWFPAARPLEKTADVAEPVRKLE